MTKALKILASICLITIIFATVAYASGDHDNEYTYSEQFDTTPDSLIWQLLDAENISRSISGGAVNMLSGDSLRFNCTKTDVFTTFDANKIYTYEFDFKITEPSNASFTDGSYTDTVFSISFGGYYTQIEINGEQSLITTGDTKNVPFDEDGMLNNPLHAKITHTGNTISSVLTDEKGDIISAGNCRNNIFTSIDAKDGAIKTLFIECDGGTVEIDNFTFSISKLASVKEKSFSISDQQAAIYKCEIECLEDQPTALRLGASELFSYNNGIVRLASTTVGGTYIPGKYTVTVYICNAQNVLNVSLTQPDGTEIRRGAYDLLGSDTLRFYAKNKNQLISEKLTYEKISLNEYSFTEFNPDTSSSNPYIYNIVSSFSDPKSTRSFAWTANSEFVDGRDMCLQYREKNSIYPWEIATAIRQDEYVEVKYEDFFKVDLHGLENGKEYEYRIGIEASSEQDLYWTDIYTFKTVKKTVDEFSFIAIGNAGAAYRQDDNVFTPDYSYTKSVIDQAVKNGKSTAFILHAGVLTSSSDSTAPWNAYFRALGAHAYSTPHFTTAGDSESTTDAYYFSLHFNHPDNGKSAFADDNVENQTASNLADKYSDTVYSFDYGDAHFTVLNSSLYGSDNAEISETQKVWIENDLEGSKDTKWKIVILDCSIYDAPQWLRNLIESYGVDLVIQGRSRTVSRTYPMKDASIATKKYTDVIPKGVGTVYTTIGSTSRLSNRLEIPDTDELITVYTPHTDQPTYTNVSVDNDRIKVSIKQINGYVIDEFIIGKDTDSENEAMMNEVIQKEEEEKNTRLTLIIIISSTLSVAVAASVTVLILYLRKKKAPTLVDGTTNQGESDEDPDNEDRHPMENESPIRLDEPKSADKDESSTDNEQREPTDDQEN